MNDKKKQFRKDLRTAVNGESYTRNALDNLNNMKSKHEQNIGTVNEDYYSEKVRTARHAYNDLKEIHIPKVAMRANFQNRINKGQELKEKYYKEKLGPETRVYDTRNNYDAANNKLTPRHAAQELTKRLTDMFGKD